jgi:hypothetical protein
MLTETTADYGLKEKKMSSKQTRVTKAHFTLLYASVCRMYLKMWESSDVKGRKRKIKITVIKRLTED